MGWFVFGLISYNHLFKTVDSDRRNEISFGCLGDVAQKTNSWFPTSTASIQPQAAFIVLATHQAVCGEGMVVLSAREFALLHEFLLHPGRILSRAQLEEHLYGINEEVESNAVDFLIHGVRKKLARMQTGRAETTVVDVSKMARELIAEYLPMVEAGGIDLGLDESDRLTLSAVAENLYLILRNALENALKYSPQGEEVTLNIYETEESAVLEIIDNGPGIPVSERERVFDPFYRLPETSEAGSGLGLAIAMEAAICQGGIVSLHNRQEGSGLIFRYNQDKTTALPG
jgi:signal transduction histidine kinase